MKRVLKLVRLAAFAGSMLVAAASASASVQPSATGQVGAPRQGMPQALDMCGAPTDRAGANRARDVQNVKSGAKGNTVAMLPRGYDWECVKECLRGGQDAEFCWWACKVGG